MILDDVIRALEEGRSPIVLTERKDHLEYFASRLERVARRPPFASAAFLREPARSRLENLRPTPPTSARFRTREKRHGSPDRRKSPGNPRLSYLRS